jgi:predicted transcriptional regulator
MAQIDVPERSLEELKDLASQDNRPVQAIVDEAIASYLSFRHTEPARTPDRLEQMRTSIAQGDRGDVISQEEVEAFLDDWEKEAAAR